MPEDTKTNIPVLSELFASGNKPDYLLWIGCAGSFDDRYKKVIHSLVRVLNLANIDFAVLGPEESCTGDPAIRAGNEFLFQMMALSNIQVLNSYEVKKIITACPHCYNTLKNEYPQLGGNYEVIYHDSCYLGRSNNIFDSPRNIIRATYNELIEFEKNRNEGLCCGAGGSQMFKESEPGNKEINIERTEQALETKADKIITACPFCMTMISDGIKVLEKEEKVEVIDVVELFERAQKNQ